jgi:DNA polymerase-3 subunit alpha
MDDFGDSRRSLMQRLPEALKSAEQQARAAAAGQNDMFGLVAAVEAEAAPVLPSTAIADLLEWSNRELLALEKEALGLYLTGHPFDAVRRDAHYFVDAKLADLSSEPAPLSSGERGFVQARRDITVAGLVMDVRKRGNRVTVTLDDDSGRLDVSLFSEAFQEFRHLLSKDEIVVVGGTLRYDEFMGTWQLNAKKVAPIDRVIEARAQGMILRLAPNSQVNGQGNGQGNGRALGLLSRLHDLLLPYRDGTCDVAVQYTGTDAAARLTLGPEWAVRPSRELRDKLAELLGHDSVRLLYAPQRENALPPKRDSAETLCRS